MITEWKLAWCQWATISLKLFASPDSDNFHYQNLLFAFVWAHSTCIHTRASDPSKISTTHCRTCNQHQALEEREWKFSMVLRTQEKERRKEKQTRAPTTTPTTTETLNFHRHRRASEVHRTSPKKDEIKWNEWSLLYTHESTDWDF